MFFDCLASFNEGTALAGFGELILVLVVRFNVEVLNPGTAENVFFLAGTNKMVEKTHKLSVPKKKTQEALFPEGFEMRLRSLGGLAI